MSEPKYYFFDNVEYKKVALEDGMVFGRKSSCDVMINDNMVSGQHFKVQVEHDEVYVIDLESHNKTFINDEEIKPNSPYKLQKNDILRVGEYEYTFNSRAKEKLSLPDMSQSLRFDDIETLEEKENMMTTNDYADTRKVDVQRKDTFQRLKASKKYLNELENSKDEIAGKIKMLNDEIHEHKNMVEEYSSLSKKLAKSKFQSHDDYESEINRLNITIEEHNVKINESLAKIDEIKKYINELKSEIKVCEKNIKVVNDEHGVFQKKEDSKVRAEELASHIQDLKELQLDDKLEYVSNEIDEETKKYKELQADYGVSLYSVKKKSRSK